MTKLADDKCVPCRGGEGGVAPGTARELMGQVPAWKLAGDSKAIERRFSFADFKQAMGFVNKMADLAEAEGHHPDFTVSYKNVDVRLTTHDVGGLSRNDFIVAAKLDGLTAR